MHGGNSNAPLTLDLAFPAALAQLCVRPMSKLIRHFVASGLTIALLFSVVKHFPEPFVNCTIGHPTTKDMVIFLAMALLSSAAIVSLVVFPLLWFAERSAERYTSAASMITLAVLPLIVLFSLGGGAVLLASITLLALCIFLAPFCFYWSVIWLLRAITKNHVTPA